MNTNKLFPIAKVTQVTGLKGEVRVRPLSRYFEDYISSKPLFLGLSEQYNRETKIIEKKGTGKKIRFRFEGMKTRVDAESLLGQFVFASVPEDDKINQIASELIGSLMITDTGLVVGELKEILWLPTNDVYVIQSDEKEILIPVIPEIVKDVNVDEGVIVIHPMDGLID